jgi:3-dehydrosphinganine reductase
MEILKEHVFNRLSTFFSSPDALITAYLVVPVTCIFISFLLTYIWRSLRFALCTSKSFKGKYVLITGGSSGIGKALALKYAKLGANVIIMARTESKLAAVLDDILNVTTSADQSCAYMCCDVTDRENVDQVMSELIDLHGCPDTIINCHGAAYPGYFFQQDHSVFEKTMKLNYMGNVNVIKALAPQMAARGNGEIVIVASAAAVVSFIGYSSYSPSKFALRGLADALRSELSGFGVRVSIAYPPDTDTEGFKREQEIAPPETAACFPADPFNSEVVATSIISSILLGDYHIQSPDLLQNMLISSMSGVTPRPYLIMEMLLAPILLLVEQLFWPWFDYQARCYKKSDRAPVFTEVEDEELKEE